MLEEVDFVVPMTLPLQELCMVVQILGGNKRLWNEYAYQFKSWTFRLIRYILHYRTFYKSK